MCWTVYAHRFNRQCHIFWAIERTRMPGNLGAVNSFLVVTATVRKKTYNSWIVVRSILKSDLKFHPYKMKAVRELIPRDFQNRPVCSEWLLEVVQKNVEFFSYETYFQLSGFVTKLTPVKFKKSLNIVIKWRHGGQFLLTMLVAVIFSRTITVTITSDRCIDKWYHIFNPTWRIRRIFSMRKCIFKNFSKALDLATSWWPKLTCLSLGINLRVFFSWRYLKPEVS